MGVGACTRIVTILGALGVVMTSTPLAAQDELAAGQRLLEAGRYAAAEALLGPLLAVQSANGRETASALETTDLWVEARAKGGKAGLPETLAAAEQVVRIRER